MKKQFVRLLGAVHGWRAKSVPAAPAQGISRAELLRVFGPDMRLETARRLNRFYW